MKIILEKININETLKLKDVLNTYIYFLKNLCRAILTTDFYAENMKGYTFDLMHDLQTNLIEELKKELLLPTYGFDIFSFAGRGTFAKVVCVQQTFSTLLYLQPFRLGWGQTR